ncbi:MAG: dienelactone hydrolase family protein, partial [Spirosomaceae bacterium]|nr:dienelactone hydrolase family protein [Spirosomataceae bacterium]
MILWWYEGSHYSSAQINAPLLIHSAALDQRVNAGWDDYKAALNKEGKEFSVHFYDNVNHGFHNNSTP